MFLLQQCGFSEKLRRWIKCCISTVKFSILINSSPSDFFGSSRGLRQGDPLSPFLFDIVMEALSRMLVAATAAGQFSGFTVGNVTSSLMKMSHLLFADDTLVFCDADSNHITTLHGILSRFEEMSGLKINLGKFELVPVGDVPNLLELVKILGCRESALLLKYLGLPLGASFKDKMIRNPIFEKMERRLAGWKRLYLSKGGKVILIKSTLSSLPMYFLSLFPIPGRVAKRMEKLQRNFLWNGIGDNHKIHLVDWSKICRPVKNGGIGIRCWRRFNSALLAKWLWRYGLENDALWRRVIGAKYGNKWGGWSTKSVSRAYGVCLWKFIRTGWWNFSKFIRYEVGDGTRVKFWDNVWCRDCPLKEAFLDLYNISRTRDASVSEVIQFRRLVNDQESQSLDSFMVLIYSTKVRGVGSDNLCWKPASNQGFKVSGYYHSISLSTSISFPWKMVWQSKVPPRVAFFSWIAALGKILTIDNLQKRHFVVLEWCFMCKRCGESVDHLLLHCPIAYEMWSMIFCLFGICWVMPQRVVDLLNCWTCNFRRHRNIVIWRFVPHCLMWCIWRERNSGSFKGRERSIIEFKSFFFFTLLEWCLVLPSFFLYFPSCVARSL